MREKIATFIRERQTLLTVFAIAVIIFGGAQMVDNPDNWWWTPVFVLSALAVVIIFLHARVIIKAFITVVAALLSYYISMIQGDMIDIQLGLGGIIASSAVLSLFFLSLGLSYLLPSNKSRWTSITLTIIVHQILEYVLVIAFLHLYWGIGVSFALALLFFIAFYSLSSWKAYRSKKMPQNIASDILTDNISEAFTQEGWNFKDMRKKGNKGGYLVWKDKAFLLWPVRMDQDLLPYSSKDLRYNNKSIGSWLSAIAGREIPSLKAKNADIMPVLLDFSNGNGALGQIIGVNMPDTKKLAHFGIFPGRELNSNSKNKKPIIENFENKMGQSIGELTEKEKKALNKIKSSQTSAK